MSAIYIELLTECIKRLPRLTYFYRICKCQLSWASALNCTVAPRKELACNNKNNCNENHSTLFTDSLSSGSDEEIFGSPSFSCSASYQKTRRTSNNPLSAPQVWEWKTKKKTLKNLNADGCTGQQKPKLHNYQVRVYTQGCFFFLSGWCANLAPPPQQYAKFSSACSSGGLTHPGKHHVES